MTKEVFVQAGFNLALQTLYERAGKTCPAFFEQNLPSLNEALLIAGHKSASQPGYAPLASIFCAFGLKKDEKPTANLVYDSIGQPAGNSFAYPQSNKKRLLSKADYAKLIANFEAKFAHENWQEMPVNKILSIWQQYTCLVPAEDTPGEYHDVSLYMRTKMAAAIAACQAMPKDAAEDNAFLMLSGDISGIQDFIYTIPSDGALKSLRGRSFYLEIFMENFIDELLERLNLTRLNLLYVGGGHFYILTGNNEKARRQAKTLQNNCNHWFLKNYGTKLYLALGYSPCSADDLKDAKLQGNIFHKVSEAINEDKLRRYANAEDTSVITALFNPKSSYNKHQDSSRECGICHNSTLDLHNNSIVDCLICQNCDGLLQLGKKLIEENCLFVIGDQATDQSVAIFGGDRDLYLQALKEKELHNYPGQITRIYCKQGYTENADELKALSDWELNLVDYSARDKSGNVKDFEKLSLASISEEKGIKRLAVLRADVDNLGAAFLGGFNYNVKNRDTNLTHYADLSSALAVFFKRAVDKICDGELPPGQSKFHLFGENPGKRQIHVVYSGGDDMFFVGAWEDLLELAIDIREAFRTFTNNKLSFSAGLALFHHAYPISKMAEQTGELESIGKKLPKDADHQAKDGLALFGLETELKNQETVLECPHKYKWDVFENEVCKEKLKYLLANLAIGETEDKSKIKIGKGQLYKLLNLLDMTDQGDIKFARLVYWLGRLQPRKEEEEKLARYEGFSRQMYTWFKEKEQRRQLRTAIILWVYQLRDTEKE